MKFNRKLTFAVAGVGERHVWCYCSAIAHFFIMGENFTVYCYCYLGEQICPSNLSSQPVRSQNVYRLWIQTATNRKVINLQSLQWREVCENSRRDFLDHVVWQIPTLMCTCFLIFGFETEKSIYFNKKHVSFKIQIQIKSKLSICTKQLAVWRCSMDLKKAVSPSFLGHVVLKRGALEAAVTRRQKFSDIRSRIWGSYKYHCSCSKRIFVPDRSTGEKMLLPEFSPESGFFGLFWKYRLHSTRIHW